MFVVEEEEKEARWEMLGNWFCFGGQKWGWEGSREFGVVKEGATWEAVTTPEQNITM
jgi:hypothetical protein